MSLGIAVLQSNFWVGDLFANAQKIIDGARSAHEKGAKILLTPELALSGYTPCDALLRADFLKECQAQLDRVIQETAELKGLALVIGYPAANFDENDNLISCQNSACIIFEGRVLAYYAKQNLPNYRIFDEKRYFTAGDKPCVWEMNGVRIGVIICEDAWVSEPAMQCKHAGANLLLVLNASPFHMGKNSEREMLMADRARECGMSLIYAHMCGAQDEIVFEGHSFALNADGSLAGRAPSFEEALWLCHVQLNTLELRLTADIAPTRTRDANLWDALVWGLRDYVHKNGFKSVMLGLSGGIDSALVLAIAVDALGSENVFTVMMPSPYTAEISLQDAKEMANRLNVHHEEISINPAFDALTSSLSPVMSGEKKEGDVTEENLQARIRGVLLMALSNRNGHLLLTTGNKSEYAVGYCTLYGDMCGGFAPIKDVLKTKVFNLARWRNAHNPYKTFDDPIPWRIITRPPSAELREGQTDQDSLPSYEILDEIIWQYMEKQASASELIQHGFEPEDVEKVLKLIKLNEYKRAQAAVGTRVSKRAFGGDWRYPITNSWRSKTS